jgi:hypothetical protein
MTILSQVFIKIHYPNTNLLLQHALTVMLPQVDMFIIVYRNITKRHKCFSIGALETATRKLLAVYAALSPGLLWMDASSLEARAGVLGWGIILTRTVTGSIHDVIGIFLSWSNPLSRTMALEKTQPGAEMGVKGGLRVKLTTSPSVWADCLENVGTSKSHYLTGSTTCLKRNILQSFTLTEGLPGRVGPRTGLDVTDWG